VHKLEPIEAKVPTRTPRMAEPEAQADSLTVRFAPLANLLSGPIFTRSRDIIAVNVTVLRDRSEDPARLIRMIIV